MGKNLAKKQRTKAHRARKAEKKRTDRKKYRKDLRILERVKDGDIKGVLQAEVVRGLLAEALGR